jgi:hypothetical protein
VSAAFLLAITKFGCSPASAADEESAAFCFINFCHCCKKRGENLCTSKLEINPPRENFRATRKNSGPENAGDTRWKIKLIQQNQEISYVIAN